MNIREYVEINNVYFSFANECIINELERISKNNDSFNMEEEFKKLENEIGNKIGILEDASCILYGEVLKEVLNSQDLTCLLNDMQEAFREKLNRDSLNFGKQKKEKKEDITKQNDIISKQRGKIPSVARVLIRNEKILGVFNIMTAESLGETIDKRNELERDLANVQFNMKDTISIYCSLDKNLEANNYRPEEGKETIKITMGNEKKLLEA
ncbi:MAG: hypothetical protein N4A47_04280 [Clostridia bacterium]|jgi:hypothetical protein|nr:hypothetical protein [Clostridia bacterium]